MSLITLAAVAHVAKHARRHASCPCCETAPTDEERRERRRERVKTIAITLAVTLVLAAIFFGIMFAEQAGIAWLSVLLQGVLFLLIAVLSVAMLGVCLLALSGVC